MDRLGANLFGRRDDAVTVEIALGRRRSADPDRVIGLAHMFGAGVGIGIDRNAAYPERPAGAQDAAGNFAAIGNQKR